MATVKGRPNYGVVKDGGVTRGTRKTVRGGGSTRTAPPMRKGTKPVRSGGSSRP